MFPCFFINNSHNSWLRNIIFFSQFTMRCIFERIFFYNFFNIFLAQPRISVFFTTSMRRIIQKTMTFNTQSNPVFQTIGTFIFSRYISPMIHFCFGCSTFRTLHRCSKLTSYPGVQGCIPNIIAKPNWIFYTLTFPSLRNTNFNFCSFRSFFAKPVFSFPTIFFCSLVNTFRHIYLQIKKALFGGSQETVKFLHLLRALILKIENPFPANRMIIA